MTKSIAARTLGTVIARVEIVWSEYSGTDGKVFRTLAAFDQWIRTNPETLDRGYNKTQVRVIWADGESFEFRIDVNRQLIAHADELGVDVITSELVTRAHNSRTRFAGSPLAYAPELIALVDARIGQLVAA